MYNEIKDDLKNAMMAQDKDRVGTLRMVVAALDNEAIAKGKKDRLDPDDCVVVLKRMVKSRQDSIEQFRKGGAEDRALAEQAEINIISTYLPKMLTQEKLAADIEVAMAETGATTKKDTGKVMKWLKDVHGNGFDGKMASQILQGKLV